MRSESAVSTPASSALLSHFLVHPISGWRCLASSPANLLSTSPQMALWATMAFKISGQPWSFCMIRLQHSLVIPTCVRFRLCEDADCGDALKSHTPNTRSYMHMHTRTQRVTIFGESAGAGSVSDHLVAPRSWPFFQGAIMESSGAADW